MKIINKNIDSGKAFDWGKISSDYSLLLNIQSCKYMLLILEKRMIGAWLQK